jgi:hypothetical protein
MQGTTKCFVRFYLGPCVCPCFRYAVRRTHGSLFLGVPEWAPDLLLYVVQELNLLLLHIRQRS